MTNREKRSALIGMILGDGYINKNNSFRIVHCQAQKDYLFFKTKILQEFQKRLIIPQKFDNSGYVGWRIHTQCKPMYRILRNKIYIDGKKTITRKILNWLTPLGIAIWFMDDGSTSYKIRHHKIHAVETTINTYLSKEQNEVIIKYFQEIWNIRFGLNKAGISYRLRCGTQEARKLVQLISQFVVDSMKYKINKLSIKDETLKK